MVWVRKMKTLKFHPYLVQPILNGVKDTTWRLFDDKNLKKGDELSLLNWVNLKEFAKAKVIFVKETRFCELTDEDWGGHEEYKSKDEMYKKYSLYYGHKVDGNTKLKIIKFKLK